MDSFFKKSYLEPKQVRGKLSTKAVSDVASPSQSLTIAIAISGSAKSKNVVKWALKKFASEKHVVFRLIHIHPKITSEDVVEETILKPYKKMCERKKVAVQLVVLESNSVAVAITREVNQHLISRLVIGRSSHVGLYGDHDITAKISACVSNLCTVYVVSEGVYILSKEKSLSDAELNENFRDSSSERSTSSSGSDAFKSNSLTLSNKHLPTIVRGVSEETSPTVSRFRDLDAMSCVSSNHDFGKAFIDDQEALEEITKLRAELRHAQDMYALAQVESLDASRKLSELNLEDKEEEKLEESSFVQYQEFTWEEIIAATSSFSEDLKIGIGVYKCNVHHTIAAVKVLHSAETNLSKQFDQELKILSKMRHPHLLLLLGACPEHGALVYEYMQNGSLEDRLFQVNNTQPIPWFVRFRIAWEVASALLFLHKSKPTPIIHRDLKPGNILLDHNFVSKVGDVGLSTMIQVDSLSTKFTSPVGTLCYIDPEYQRTGMLSPKSDVYAFGMIILQLLTAQPAIALTYTVEIAMENNDLIQILDKKAGDWPIEETRQLAALALHCTELRAKDRPDLENQILPTLESLNKVSEKARNLISSAPKQPPTHFLCPLLKDVMNEPCVAADGYTYDRQAIEEWMEDNHTSPVTNLPLQNINLLPNHTLYAAIVEWRRRNQ